MPLMRVFSLLFFVVVLAFCMAAPAGLRAENTVTAPITTLAVDQHGGENTEADQHGESAEAAHHKPAAWSIFPFVLLLLMIATGPLFYEHF